ncbi:MAG: ribosomal maturation YjgA family protein [Planctomycetota bacterium]|jgi:hypothetical protein
MSSGRFKLRLWALVSIVVIVPLGFALKFYGGPGQAWVNNSLAGVAYEIFWCLAVFAAWPRRAAITRIVAGVFTVTCALEILQLWNPPWLEAIRSTWAGRAIVGTTFVWSDFAYYVLGCALGWLWLHAIARGAPEAPPRSPGTTT